MHNSITSERAVAMARLLFLRQLQEGPTTFTEVARDVPLPKGRDGRLFGGMVASLHRDGIIEHDGFAPSSNTDGNSRRWRLVDHSKGAAQ